MGNKKVYVNAKALAAKERLEQKKIAEKERLRLIKDEREWHDEGSKIQQKRAARKALQEQKKEATLSRKKAAKEALEEENKQLKGKKENAPKKITQHEILLMKEEKLNSANLEKNLRPNFELPDFINPNKEKAALLAEGHVEAQGIDEALS
ncbi:caldesmon-like [Zophobas morio]|uniref:caldesmon-like n=1 Tax=Zophobas morio TaxID=2755281 RepID=UPI0030830A7A